ncbi:MAG: PIN domain-containing protein [Ignavibacteria bacterium]|nr:PIN domain-containing protein [Ignavibacteria bacterium]HCN37189.1 VapC toxin family PIN domain ribonuclease [Bacteroidota bacterium]
MIGSNILLDTNVILYFIGGRPGISELIDSKKIYISFITELELQLYKYNSENDIKIIKNFLNETNIVDINGIIKSKTIELSKKYSIKLADSIIAATSIFLNTPIFTADKQFRKIKELDLIFYTQ